MSDVIHKVSLEDVFNDMNLAEFIRYSILTYLKTEIVAFCKNEDISLGQVDMQKTIESAQVTFTIEPFKGLI